MYFYYNRKCAKISTYNESGGILKWE